MKVAKAAGIHPAQNRKEGKKGLMYTHGLYANGRHAVLRGAAAGLACVGLLAGPAFADASAAPALADTWYNGHTWKVGAESHGPGPVGGPPGKDYPVIHSRSPLELRTEAKILYGRNTSGDKLKVEMEWGYRSPDEQWLSSDLLRVTGNEGNQYVLQMSYDEATLNGMEKIWAKTGEQTIYTRDSGGHWVNVWDYMGTVLGETVVPSGSSLYNFQGSWDKAGKPFDLGAWGVDTKKNVVWAVIDFDGVFVPEPGTMAMLALGGLGVLLRRRRKT